MSESSELTEMVSTIYLISCFAIPILYIIIYALIKRKKKKKNFGKAIGVALCLLIVLFGLKLVLRLNIAIFDYPNCYINNICANDVEQETPKKENKKTTTTTTTNTTSESTTTTTTTTTTKKTNVKTYNKLKENSGTKENQGKTSKGYDIYTIDGVTYVDGYLIANKTYFLPTNYAPAPADTNKKADPNATQTCNDCIVKEVYSAYKDMKADAKAVGLNIYISSGYRSYTVQKNLYERYVKRDGQKEADTYSARAGSSEHQTGLCFDLNSISDSFTNTKEGKWVNQNAYKYGFIIRYPKGKDNETGYMYESWHLRYVGTELAEKLYNNGNWISMEEYFGITSKYAED